MTPTDQVRDALKAALASCGDRYYGNKLPEEFDVVEEGEWTQDYKYQIATDIVRHVESGRHFEVTQSRSGSYHTDWYYNDPDLGNEVRQVEKTIVRLEWEPVA